MKRRLLFCLMGMWLLSAQAQVDRWDEVAQLEEQSLPASALEVVNAICQEALKSGNTPEIFKAFIHQLKYETAIDSDALPERILEIEQFAETEKDPVGQAVLYSLLAEIYTQYYLAHAYAIRQRTPLAGEAPNDLREWTKNHYQNKAKDLVRLSLLPVSELQKTKTSAYRKILTEGDSLPDLRPTMYDFLMDQGIRILSRYDGDAIPAVLSEMYEQWLGFRRLQLERPTDSGRLSLLMVELDRAEWIRQHPLSGNAGEQYLQTLSDLETQYRGEAISVEILYRKARYYLENSAVDKAYAVCTEGLETWSSYARKGLLQNLLNEITHSKLIVTGGKTVYPGKALELKLNYRNIRRLWVEIYRIEGPITDYPRIGDMKGRYKTAGRRIEKRQIDLKVEAPYLDEDTIIRIPMGELGNYEYLVYSDEIKNEKDSEGANRQFSVSRLATVARAIDGSREFWVVDRMTGKPIEGAKLQLYSLGSLESAPSLSAQLQTDKIGLVRGSNKKEQVFYNASFGNDTALVLSVLPWIPSYQETTANPIRVQLFTDRSIYRPGQILYFKGVAFKPGEKAEPNKTCTLTFRDANGKEIATRKLKTNEFGSFHGEFLIPRSGLTGAFTLHTDVGDGQITVRVEEYKRPSFDIRFTPQQEAYRLGRNDTVTVRGYAASFSGVHLKNMPVRYRILRKHHGLFRIRYSPPVVLTVGEVQTQSDGSFAIRFPANKAPEDGDRPNVCYTYTVEATVTDSNGETQTASTQLSVGEKSIYLVISGPTGVVEKEKPIQPLRIQALNLAGNPVATQGTCEIYRLKTESLALLDENDTRWTPEKQIRQDTFVSGEEIASDYLRALPSGRYRIIARADDGNGQTVETQTDFTLASTADKRPPVPVYEWLLTPKTVCAAGEKAEILYGSSAKGVYVLYELFKENKKLAASCFVLNNEIRKIEIPFQEAYGDEITASFSFVKDGKFFTQNVHLARKKEDRHLNLKIEVFRDRLLPGQQEEWTVSAKDAANRPVFAEWLASMYDASLDKIYAHRWDFDPSRPLRKWTPYNRTGNDWRLSYASLSNALRDTEIKDFTYPAFNLFGFHIRSGERFAIRGNPGLRFGSLNPEAVVVVGRGKQASGETLVGAAPLSFSESASDNADVSPALPVQIRENFSETAFFYPRLTTDEAGETRISFTVPESNTTWKFRGLAHTQDLKFGQIEQEIISRKPLMIAPNLPRFLRAGDRATLLTNISNQTDHALSGTAKIDFLDPVSDQTLIAVAQRVVPFTLEAGQTAPVSWSFEVPDSVSLTRVRITASTSDFSDGEQHWLPVLPNRMLVTESLPLYHPSGGSPQVFSLAPLLGKTSPSMEDYRVTLEFTSNPIWYAIQALPALSEPTSDNALSLFAACYVNVISSQLANSDPSIRQTIESWTRQEAQAETLESPLEKNQELKTTLLEETPWVLEAENESAQKQSLITLFDANRLAYNTEQTLEKLQALQTAAGGWPWFKGMSGNVSITQWILYRMAEIRPKGSEAMIEKALKFIDNQFEKHYETLKAQTPRWENLHTLSRYELEYLLIHSRYSTSPKEESEAVRFYTAVIEKHWNKHPDLYSRALAALVLQQNGSSSAAKAIVRSLREHATRKPDLGMYWANNSSHCFMSQSAVCVHTFIMEAFLETGASPAEMDEMKLWLLRQKQTQDWGSAPTTVNAVNLLLKTGDNWLTNSGTVTISLDGRPLALKPIEAGAGYIKDSETLKNQKTGRLKIEKKTPGPAFGAVYRQYFEDLDKITPSKTGLSLGKTRIAPADQLQTGDKIIIRLTVRADRDMEFVHLKDQSASCFEPADRLSGVRWKQGLIYYQSPRDASMNFFFPVLPKGTYVLEYEVYATAPGNYSGGLASIQCLYAPEFVSHTAGERIQIIKN